MAIEFTLHKNTYDPSYHILQLSVICLFIILCTVTCDQQVHSHVNLSSILVTFKVGTLATFGPLSSTPAARLSQPFLSTGR